MTSRDESAAAETDRRPTIALLGALDTKAAEFDFLQTVLARAGCTTLLLDIGVLGTPGLEAEVARHEVALAGGTPIEELRKRQDRNAAMLAMSQGAASKIWDLHAQGSIDGVLAAGGSNAAYVMSVVSTRLPIGFPKVLVSTVAASDPRPYIARTDVALINPIVDLNGINRISRRILTNAAHACAGMAGVPYTDANDEAPIVAMSMFGVTTGCGMHLASQLKFRGIEVLTFHANGVGGQIMEDIIRSNQVSAVAEMTTTELADELLGGVCSAGPDRFTAAAQTGVPQVVSLGALDMVNFGPYASVPAEYQDRVLHKHNPEVTLMRTNAEECAELGTRLADTANASSGPITFLIPTMGLSQISKPGDIFYAPEADAALIDSLTSKLHDRIQVRRFKTDINDPVIAEAAAEILADWCQHER